MSDPRKKPTASGTMTPAVSVADIHAKAVSRVTSRADVNQALDAVTDGERDNYKLINKLNDRLQKVGMTLPGIEVRWENFKVELEPPRRPITNAIRKACASASTRDPTPGPPDLQQPSDAKPGHHHHHHCLTSNPHKKPAILDAGSGVLPPGRMCLLLGPPGAGRTTLLKALAGQLIPPAARGKLPKPPHGGSCDPSAKGQGPAAQVVPVVTAGHLRVHGRVSYNGLPADGSAFEVARAATYVAQTENHLAELTVAETLTFASECQGVGMARRLHDLLAEREAAAGVAPDDPNLELLLALSKGPLASSAVVENVARMLSIDHVMDTVVGNELLKGISGGQKRRVTIGEMVVGMSQVIMADEITNGLDANSALAIVKALQNLCEHANCTVLATLLQPSPEVVSCFHDVMLISAGRLLFHGPTDHLLGYFASMGLAPFPQQPLADFAQEVTASPQDQARYRVAVPGAAAMAVLAPGGKGALAAAPAGPGAAVAAAEAAAAAWAGGHKWISPKRMRRIFESSPAGQTQAAQLAAPPYTHPLQDLVLRRERYGTSMGRMWSTVMRREATLFRRNTTFFMAGVIQVVFVGFLVATGFVNLSHNSPDDANLYMSVTFYSLMTLFMTGFNFGPIYCQRLPVFYKQRDHRFYSPAAYAVSAVVMKLPDVLVQAVAYSVMVYFSVRFTMDLGRFLLYLVNMLVAGINSVTTFTLIAAIMRNETATQGMGAVVMMVSVLVSGFPIAPSSIPGWWIWFHWITPMSWGLRSMLVSEFTSDAWGPSPNQPGVSIGMEALQMRGMYTGFKWVWAGIGVVAGISMLQVAMQAVALAWLGPLRISRKGPDYDPDEDGEDRHLLSRNSRSLVVAPPAAGTASASARSSLNLGSNAHANGETATEAQGREDEQQQQQAPDWSSVTSSSSSRSSSIAAAAARSPHARPSPSAATTAASLPGRLPTTTADPAADGAAGAKSANPAPAAAPSSVAVPSLESLASIRMTSDGTRLTAAAAEGEAGGDVEAGAGAPNGGVAVSSAARPGSAGSRHPSRPTSAAHGGDGDRLLDFKRVVMTFRDVSYFVRPNGDKKELQLLKEVSGVFRPGVLTSLMGASGAGKTTLMDVLAGRKTGGRVEGQQLVNGARKRMSTFARLMGYVEQLDVHNPHTTIEEALVFSAHLRVGSDLLSASAVRPFVRHMMQVVELEPLAHRIIGVPGAGLSTEARKRLTIAVELVANPSIVFMDEPTTGLDARAAGLVMRAVRNTVATGRTVVCTIHQPNREIMNHFDELLLLKPGGRTIYFGPLGEEQRTLVSYFSAMPGVSEYLPHKNPANWMLDVTSPSAETTLGVDFADVWAASEQARAANLLIDQYSRKDAIEASTAAAAAAAPHPPRRLIGSGGGSRRTRVAAVESYDPSAAANVVAIEDDIEAGYRDKPQSKNGIVAGASSGATRGSGPADRERRRSSGEDGEGDGDGDGDGAGDGSSRSLATRFAQPTRMQLWLLLKRALVSHWRNVPYNGTRLVITLVLSFVLGSLYWGQGDNTGTVVGLFNIMGVMFSASLFVGMTNLMMVMPLVLSERAVFYREKASGMYRAWVFAMSQGLAELPIIFVQSVLYVVIMYTTVHFEFEQTKALWFWLYQFLGLLVCSTLGIGMMNIAPNSPAAIAGCSGCVLLWNLFCGFLIYRKDIKPWYLWAYYGNPFTFIIYGCVTTQLGNEWDSFVDTGTGTVSVAQYIEDTFSYNYEFRGWIVLILIGFIGLFRGAAYLGLTRFNFQNR